MRVPAILLIGASFAIVSAAEAAPARKAAARPVARHLDLSNPRGPSVAMQAAQATQAASTQPGAAPRLPAVAAPVTEAATSASADTVSGLTVRPDTPQRGVVIASTSASSLTSPDFSAVDAESAPLAVAIGDNAALGKRTVDNSPPMGGLLRNNPDLLGGQQPVGGPQTRGAVGVTAVF